MPELSSTARRRSEGDADQRSPARTRVLPHLSHRNDWERIVMRTRLNSPVKISCVLLAMLLMLTLNVYGGKKKKVKEQRVQPAPPSLPQVDTSNLVWPDPPDIARIRWIEQYRGEPSAPVP